MIPHVALFFFSSRRRHTRSTRDWSSDVCSSDLGADVRGLFCPEHLHHQHFASHKAFLGKHGQSYAECNRLDYLQDLTDPKLPLNARILDLLSKPYVHRGRNAYDHSKACTSTRKANLTPLLNSSKAANFHELFEGVRESRSPPPNICMYQYESSISS